MPSRILMCAPDFFGVQYTINPWMENQIGTVDPLRARREWSEFYKSVKQRTQVELIPARPNVPDLVFTANSGLQRGNRVIPSRFRHRERRAEEPLFTEWFRSAGYEVLEMDDSIFFEGAGDALFQPDHDVLWAGYGFRTDREAHDFIAAKLKVRVLSLRLIDRRFYHLDTCFCPLPNNRILYYPEAFDEESLKLIEEHTLSKNRILVSTEDAFNFACNALVIENVLFMNHASAGLCNRLERLGYMVSIHPVTEFLKAGGANKCLTLHLAGPTHRNTFLKTPRAERRPSSSCRKTPGL
ncbi:MAG: arginine deiminase-related protein [Nitrospinaceae bacterium]